MSKRNIVLYLEDIKNSIKKIEEYTRGLSFADFAKNQMAIDAVVRNFEIMGEAANNIPKRFKVKHPEVPWRQIIGTRNSIIHEYFGIDLEIIWSSIQEDIPKLKEQIIRCSE